MWLIMWWLGRFMYVCMYVCVCVCVWVHIKNMGLKNLSKVCHIDKFWVVISMVPKTTSLLLSRQVSVAKLVKRSSSRTKQYMSVSNHFYFFSQKGHNKNYWPKSSILDLAVANWRYMHIYKLILTKKKTIIPHLKICFTLHSKHS